MKQQALSLIRSLPMGAVHQEALLFYLKLGYWPDFANPTTYNEKLNYRKLFSRDERFTRCSDKLAVRDWVRDRIGPDCLVPLLYSGESITEQQILGLGDNLVIKASHDSRSTEIIRRNSPAIAEAAAKRIRAKLRTNYGLATNQFFYSPIQPRVLVEQLLVEGSKPTPNDYKILCFRQPDGSLKKWVDVHQDRDTPDYAISFYDERGQAIPLKGVPECRSTPPAFPCPDQWKDLLGTADALGREFDHVRVDLYCIEGAIYFGELSFCAAGGRSPYSRLGGQPHDLDRTMGAYWHLAS